MAEQWEYKVPQIAWNDEKKCFQASMPNGSTGESNSIGLLLNWWGAEGWELVSVTPERYVADDIFSANMYTKMAGVQVAGAYLAFLKRRKP